MSIVAGEDLRTDVLVIGAGQAGLAAANALEEEGLDFLIIDELPAVGDSWRNRYDGLTLFTPRSISALPGMPLVGDPDGYAGKDEFADYLARYAARSNFKVVSSTRIVRLLKVGGVFEAFTEGGHCVSSRAVIVATGSFQVPRIPALSAAFASSVRQCHVADLREFDISGAGTVLIVGDGASGRDMALALAGSRKVLLAGGRKRRLLPERILGRSVWWWLGRLGLLRASADSIVGQRMRKADPFPSRGNDDATLSRLGVMRKSRLVAVDGENATFEDDSTVAVTSVIWATGYRDDFHWIEIDGAIDGGGAALHRNGVSDVEHLYFVGRPWQRNRASGLIAGVGDDAAFVVKVLRQRSVKRQG